MPVARLLLRTRLSNYPKPLIVIHIKDIVIGSIDIKIGNK